MNKSSSWESGDAMPTAAKLPQIAALYKCSINDLFEQPRALDCTLDKLLEPDTDKEVG